jgi:hypothetical protein
MGLRDEKAGVQVFKFLEEKNFTFVLNLFLKLI